MFTVPGEHRDAGKSTQKRNGRSRGGFLWMWEDEEELALRGGRSGLC